MAHRYWRWLKSASADTGVPDEPVSPRLPASPFTPAAIFIFTIGWQYWLKEKMDKVLDASILNDSIRPTNWIRNETSRTH